MWLQGKEEQEIHLDSMNSKSNGSCTSEKESSGIWAERGK